MTRNLVCGGVVLGLLFIAARADAAPAIQIYMGRLYGSGQISGQLQDGATPGELQVGSYWIANTGTSPLTVFDMALSSSPAEFEYMNDLLCGSGTDCPHTFTLAPGEQRWFAVYCTAPAPGVYSGTLSVQSDATSGDSTSPLTCKGFHPPVLQVTPDVLDFGSAHLCWAGDWCGPSCNTRPGTQTVTITNTAPEPSEVDVNVNFDLYEYDFTIDTESSMPLAVVPGQPAHITFRYHPTPPSQVNYDTTVRLTPVYPGDLSTIDIPLRAWGGSGWFEFDGPWLLGSGPIGQPVVGMISGRNIGDSCLDIDPIGFYGAFQVLDPIGPVLLQAGETGTWQVSCTPTQAAEPTCDRFALEFPYDEPESGAQFDVCCQGLGGSLRTTPEYAWFTGDSAVAVGTSATQRLRVSNAGNQPTDLTAMTSGDPQFTVALASGSLPVTLAPGEETLIDVTFTPTDATWIDATILLDGSNGDDYSLEVFGLGVLASSAAGERAASARTAIVSAAAPSAAGSGCVIGDPPSLPLALGIVLLALRRRRAKPLSNAGD